MTRAWLLLLLAGCRPAAPVAGVPADAEPGIHEETLAVPDGHTTRYTVLIPDGYRRDRPAPLVVALHYGGEVTPFYGRNVLEILVQPALAALGAIIVAPDALDRGWTDALDEGSVLAVMDHLTKTLAIDRRRVLCTGYSMGGAGTWYLAGRHPDRFTAAIPIAGRPAELDFKVPVYVIHSSADKVMPLAPTEAYVGRLRAAGRPAELVVVDGITHLQTDRFVEPLRAAVPWLERTWAGR